MSKNLTVRLDDVVRKQLELISSHEMRTLANQISYFIKKGIDEYIKEKRYSFGLDESGPEVELVLRDENGILIDN